MRSSSPSVNPSARWSGCSGATCVKGPSLAVGTVGSGEPTPAADAPRPGGDLGVLLHVHQGRGPRGHAGGGRLRPRAHRDVGAAAGCAVSRRVGPDVGGTPALG